MRSALVIIFNFCCNRRFVNLFSSSGRE